MFPCFAITDAILMWHSDQKEGVKAFFEKRKPNFSASVNDLPPNFPWWMEVNTGKRPAAAKGESKL